MTPSNHAGINFEENSDGYEDCFEEDDRLDINQWNENCLEASSLGIILDGSR